MGKPWAKPWQKSLGSRDTREQTKRTSWTGYTADSKTQLFAPVGFYYPFKRDP